MLPDLNGFTLAERAKPPDVMLCSAWLKILAATGGPLAAQLGTAVRTLQFVGKRHRGRSPDPLPFTLSLLQ